MSDQIETNQLIAPHGGTLIDRTIPVEQRAVFVAEASELPHITLDTRELSDLELLGNGAFSPLSGFLSANDYDSVLRDTRLSDGTVWPLPINLAVTEQEVALIAPGHPIALVDADGVLRGVLNVEDVYRREPDEEASAVYGTKDPSHPGVTYLHQRSPWLVGGPVRVLPPDADALAFGELRRSPAQLRAAIAERGWRTVAGFQTRNPMHRAHEHLTKLALEVADGLVIHPLVGQTKADDIPADVRFRCYEVLLERYFPTDRTLLSVFPAAMRYAGPREALFHALVRKNYGITHLIVGRDHAGVNGFYGPFDAHAMFDEFSKQDIGIEPLRFDIAFYCRSCAGFASPRTCPHDHTHWVSLSGSKVRDLLREGADLPEEFTRREVAELLREHYRGDAASTGNGKPSSSPNEEGTPAPTNTSQGFVLWMTGLSGAGKSTLATALTERLSANQPVEVLDGDDVRTYLSKGLGFSKEDRDTNIRRIGFVARLLARNGVAALGAAISPYAEVRDEVRQLAQRDGVPFVEVYVDATLDSLVQRDVKGLYKRALAGEIQNFTGVSDPYEPPDSPEIQVRTDQQTLDESVEAILAALQQRGLYAPVEARS